MVFVFSNGAVHAAEHDYRSHGVTSFYGSYEEPKEEPQSSAPENAYPDNSSTEGNKNQVSSNQSRTSPNYSASGREIIPNAGDQDFTTIQAVGSLLLFTLVLFLRIQKKERILK